MCGIIACRTHSSAMDYLLVALGRLEYRGYDSVGVAARTTAGDVVRMRTVQRIGALDGAVRNWTGAAFDGVGIGHTRWATHGPATEGNAHPHVDCTGRISIVHNGIVENAADLRLDLQQAGHAIVTEVDSEVIAHLIEDRMTTSDDDLVDAVRSSLNQLRGSWALAVLDERSGRIVVAARRSPLLVAHTRHGDFATSDIAAVADWVTEFRALEDGEVVELTGHNGWTKHATGETFSRLIPCTWTAAATGLNGRADYMAKEIDEQPAAVARVVDEFAGGVADGGLWRSLGMAPFDRVEVIGCGTSLNAGRVIGNALRRVGGLPVRVTVASEADAEIAEPNTMRLAISQSGETADVLSATAQPWPATNLLALTNNSHSTLARRADAVVGCLAGPEIGVAATKTFVCQIVAGVAVTVSALVDAGRVSSAVAQGVVDDLRRLPDRLAAAATVAKCAVPPIIDELVDASGFIFIARGSGLPYAAEGALKLKELSYRWAEHYPAGELKHGPLALVDDGTPVVVVDNGDPRLAMNVAEVCARGGRITSIGTPGGTVAVECDPAAAWGPIESVLPLQILARDLALALGRDVDRPRNLAKSVTVE